MEDVTRFSAIEDLFHQSLDEYGNPVRTETRKFNYVASISEPQPGFLSVDEFRADKTFPDRISRQYREYRLCRLWPSSFIRTCATTSKWSVKVWATGTDRPAGWCTSASATTVRTTCTATKSATQFYPVKLKGRAWITADKFQIVRIEAEMVSPMPEIQLLSEHQVVEYGPIPFRKKNTSLWLPKSAEIYFDFRRHRYYRRHSFDHYMLFSADTEEKRKEPVAPPEKKPDAPSDNKP